MDSLTYHQMDWFRRWSHCRYPLGDALHFLLARLCRVDPFIVKYCTGGLIDSIGCYFEVSIKNVLAGDGFEYWTRKSTHCENE